MRIFAAPWPMPVDAPVTTTDRVKALLLCEYAGPSRGGRSRRWFSRTTGLPTALPLKHIHGGGL
jgi:hypothetical protein